MTYTEEVDATHLVLSCIDHRVTDDVRSVMTRIITKKADTAIDDFVASNQWDHIALPGASMGVVQSADPTWSQAFFAQVEAALGLHPKIHTIVVIDHLYCGAYGVFKPGEYDKKQRETQDPLHRAGTAQFAALVANREKTRHLSVERWLLEPCDPVKLNWRVRSLDDENVVYTCVEHTPPAG